jgi:hypothetical protein
LSNYITNYNNWLKNKYFSITNYITNYLEQKQIRQEK